MRRYLFCLLALLLASCASRPQRSGGEPAPMTKDEGVPEEIKQFCHRQCSDEIDGIPMMVRGCYEECVKDLMRSSSNQGGRRIDPGSLRWTRGAASAR